MTRMYFKSKQLSKLKNYVKKLHEKLNTKNELMLSGRLTNIFNSESKHLKVLVE